MLFNLINIWELCNQDIFLFALVISSEPNINLKPIHSFIHSYLINIRGAPITCQAPCQVLVLQSSRTRNQLSRKPWTGTECTGGRYYDWGTHRVFWALSRRVPHSTRTGGGEVAGDGRRWQMIKDSLRLVWYQLWFLVNYLSLDFWCFWFFLWKYFKLSLKKMGKHIFI